MHLHGRRGSIQKGTILALDEKEEDELISWSYSFDAMIKRAEQYIAEGNFRPQSARMSRSGNGPARTTACSALQNWS